MNKILSCISNYIIYKNHNVDEEIINLWKEIYKEYNSKVIDNNKEDNNKIVELDNEYYPKENQILLQDVCNKMEQFTFIKKEHHNTNELYNKYIDIQLTLENRNEYLKMRHCMNISAYWCNEIKSGYDCCKELILNNANIDMNNIVFNLTRYYINEIDNDNDQDRNKLLVSIINHIKKSENYGHQVDIMSNMKNIYKKYNNELYNKIESIISINTNQLKKNVNNYESSNKILIYVGFAKNKWNYTYSLYNALGGSEKAVAYISNEFSKDLDIYIAGDVDEEVYENITYVNRKNLNKLLEETHFNTIVISRYISFFLLYPIFKCNKLVISAHDTAFLNNIIDSKIKCCDILEIVNPYLDNVIVLTKWHKACISKTYPFIEDKKYKIINNGINIDAFGLKKNKIKNSFIFTSCAYRGLAKLIELWESITDQIPDATLHISSYMQFPNNEQEEDLQNIMNKYNNITHYGKLNQNELYDLMSKIEFWLYPTNFCETSCITAIEMLMSEVICLYYPIAGLVDTMGDYGIKISPGTELENINKLNEEEKNRLRKKGKEYALSCSWKNMGKIWENSVFDVIKKKKIGIYNSFPFHYEMFGFILDYAKENNFHVDIFNHIDGINNCDNGWSSFYNDNFNNFSMIHNHVFKGDVENYDLFFVTTDDDLNFKKEWIQNNVVCINHYYKKRIDGYKYYFNIAPFQNNTLEFIYPCYKLFDAQDKNIDNDIIDVCIIGTDRLDGKTFQINRLKTSLNKKIRLNIMTRKCKYSKFVSEYIETLRNDFIINLIIDIETKDMINILKHANYVLLTGTSNDDHNTCKNSSGSTELLLSTLCKAIVCNTANKYLKLKNVIEFNMNSSETIFLDQNQDFNKMQVERNEYINKRNLLLDDIRYKIFYCKKDFDISDAIPKRIVQTWETKNIHNDLQIIINSWKEKNIAYEYVFYDSCDRKKFLQEYFSDVILDTYNCIAPGAFKTDLFKLCELYVNGGLFCDLDALCISSIDNILVNDNLLFAIPIDLNLSKHEGCHNLASGFMLSKQKNPILLRCIHRIVENIQNKNIYGSILDITGPGVVGRILNLFLNNNEIESYLGKEGDHIIFNKYNIKLLKFENGTEYIKMPNNIILFQNKNGNSTIIDAYNKECNSIPNFIKWNTNNRDSLINTQ